MTRCWWGTSPVPTWHGTRRPELSSSTTACGRSLGLGDHVEVWPGHIGGSLCGGAGLSHKTSSTVGYERRHNPLLAMDRDGFVAAISASLPPRPPSVERIVDFNRAGAGDPPRVRALQPRDLTSLVGPGATIVDGRPPAEFDVCHLAGSVNLPLTGPGVGTRAGWSLDAADPLVLVAGSEPDALRLVAALQAVGLWQIEGYTLADPVRWGELELPVADASAWDVARLALALSAGEVELVDVRDPSEWLEGHVDGSHHLPLERIRELDRLPASDRPVAVACMAGGRAAFAASLLRASGRRQVFRVSGGGVPDLPAYGIALTPGV